MRSLLVTLKGRYRATRLRLWAATHKRRPKKMPPRKSEIAFQRRVRDYLNRHIDREELQG